MDQPRRRAPATRCRAVARRDAARGQREALRLLATGADLTDANAALFDAAHQFAGCIPGIHEVLRRQGLLAGRWCLDPHEELSPGQMSEIDRVLAAYPHLTDDGFVREHLDRWLRLSRGFCSSLQLAMASRECYHCKQWIEEGEAHDCWTTTEAALTQDLSDDLRDAWERLRETAAEFGEQRIYASHNSIMFSRKSCYFFVRPKKKFLEVCVFLGRP